MTRKGQPAQQQPTLDEQAIKALKAREARLEKLWKMSPERRVTAMRRGELSLTRADVAPSCRASRDVRRQPS
jgi:hypothetical protein